MTNEENALAELAKRLRNGLYINPNDKRFDGPVIVRTLDANDVLAAQRIIAELAKIQEEEAALLSMPNLSQGEAQIVLHQREVNCVLRCRAIAEEGVEK